MAGKRGMKPRSARTDTVRNALWCIIRIYKTFTIPILIETLIERFPDMTYDNTQKFIRRLVQCGHVVKEDNYKGGRPGSYQTYKLRSNEIALPVLGIGRSPKFLKQTEKEREKEENRGGES